ncbi:deoxyribose-phosphate aldolase [Orenia metallireducens]|jgi:deoxyribose-phosphate aldolase|uniref:Deoxyribose-phosphate aldolase n=1 Tax=Orenia metallireducens TaxID=1413210 RepID=A0A285FXW7_9FIRM|nr:deoxyribose-phosphate aldolase [Orenia metallireducens]PRX35544.1 deoxyribose-phosphate aldolase [Orenia metallireducens]SNY16117.1 deoxyribose-phosphate aldolase [Orenia metallireducens]
MDNKELAAMIDHTILNADALDKDVKLKCQEALEYRFASVCVNPSFVSLVNKELEGSEVKVCTVIGFPLGETTTETKIFETRNAVKNGADEIDMVINIGAIKSGAWDIVRDDIRAVVEATKGSAIVKVIIETCYLTEEEKVKACQIAKEVGAGFVKTSTGFGTGGATVEDIKLMRETVGPDMGVKASGGVRSKEDALKMIEAGATRIGASSGVAIVTGDKGTSDY